MNGSPTSTTVTDPLVSSGSRPAPSSSGRNARNPALDGLRAIAVAGVVYRHLGLPGLYGGGVGVFAFFTLSGFIITFLLCVELARTDRIHLGSFWARRARRLLPALGLLIVVGVIMGATQSVSVRHTLHQAVPALFYFSNWHRVWASYHAHSMYLGPFDHTWSLSIEEQFYVTWPLLFLLLMKLCRRRVLLVAAITVVLAEISGGLRALGWDSTNPVRSANVLYNRTDTEAELLLLGAAAGMAAWHLMQRPELRQRLSRWLLPAGGLLGLLILAGAFALQPKPDYPNRMHIFWTVGLTVTAAGVALMCLHVLVNPGSLQARLLSIPPLPQLGKISYGIYLFHYPLVIYLYPRFIHHRGVGQIVIVLATLAISTASWFLLERPIINLGRRRQARHSGRRLPAAVTAAERT